MSRRTTIKPSPLTGWDPDKHEVQVVLIDHQGPRTEYAVYLDGEHVGFVLGRPEGVNGKSYWDYHHGTSLPHNTRFVYGHTSRRQAVEHLFDAVQRGTNR